MEPSVANGGRPSSGGGSAAEHPWRRGPPSSARRRMLPTDWLRRAIIFITAVPCKGSAFCPGFNFNLYSSSFPSQERWGGYAAFEHKICDDQLRLFGDFYYVDAKTHDELAADATGSFITPGSPTRYIPPNHPFPILNGVEIPPFGGVTPMQVGEPMGAFNPFNPFEQIISRAPGRAYSILATANSTTKTSPSVSRSV